MRDTRAKEAAALARLNSNYGFLLNSGTEAGKHSFHYGLHLIFLHFSFHFYFRNICATVIFSAILIIKVMKMMKRHLKRRMERKRKQKKT